MSWQGLRVRLHNLSYTAPARIAPSQSCRCKRFFQWPSLWPAHHSFSCFLSSTLMWSREQNFYTIYLQCLVSDGFLPPFSSSCPWWPLNGLLAVSQLSLAFRVIYVLVTLHLSLVMIWMRFLQCSRLEIIFRSSWLLEMRPLDITGWCHECET